MFDIHRRAFVILSAELTFEETRVKLFIILISAVCALPSVVVAEDVKVPGVGSLWKSTSIYPPVENDGSPPRKKSETVTVDRLQEGRPVFVGSMFGSEGEIIESSVGTIVYANECRKDVPESMLEAPPAPNQCVWHVCSAPPVGKTFTRPMIIFAPLFACQPQTAMYSFVSMRMETIDGSHVTVGKATLTLNGLPRGAWDSYIEEGKGQVFAESAEKVTTYEKIIVNLVPYDSKRIARARGSLPKPPN